MNDKLGLACEHGMLARACEVCEIQAEITALRAALDQERADNAKARAEVGALRAFAQAMYKEAIRNDMEDVNEPWILEVMCDMGLVWSDDAPTALLSGRGEPQAGE